MAKKKKLSFTNGIAYIHATKNNTIITLADEQGSVLSWASSGSIGYKGTKKKTPYSAGIAAEAAAKAVIDMGLKSVEVHVNGTGASRDTAIRSLQAAGLEVTKIKDVTPIPHNGCRPPKRRRV